MNHNSNKKKNESHYKIPDLTPVLSSRVQNLFDAIWNIPI